MEELLKSLQDKQLVLSQQHILLDHNFDGVSKCLFENQMENAQFKDKHSYHYNLETKQFAMTLHYYSPKAYEFAETCYRGSTQVSDSRHMGKSTVKWSFIGICPLCNMN